MMITTSIPMHNSKRLAAFYLLLTMLTLCLTSSIASAQMEGDLVASVVDSCPSDNRTLRMAYEVNRIYMTDRCDDVLRLVAYDTNLKEVWRAPKVPGGMPYLADVATTPDGGLVIMTTNYRDSLVLVKYRPSGIPWIYFIADSITDQYRLEPRILTGSDNTVYALYGIDSARRVPGVYRRAAVVHRIESDGTFGWRREYRPLKRELLGIAGLVARNGNVLLLVSSDSLFSNKTSVRSLAIDPAGETVNETSTIYDRCCSLHVGKMVPDGKGGGIVQHGSADRNADDARFLLHVDSLARVEIGFLQGTDHRANLTVIADGRGGYYEGMTDNHAGSVINPFQLSRVRNGTVIWSLLTPVNNPNRRDTLPWYHNTAPIAVGPDARVYIAGLFDNEFMLDVLDSNRKLVWRTRRTVYEDLDDYSVGNLTVAPSGSVYVAYREGRLNEPKITVIAKYVQRIPSSVSELHDVRSRSLLSGSAAARVTTHGSTRIQFSLATPAGVTITLHDLLGRPISALADGWHASGEHSVAIDTRALGLGSGLYFACVESGGEMLTIPLLVVE